MVDDEDHVGGVLEQGFLPLDDRVLALQRASGDPVGEVVGHDSERLVHVAADAAALVAAHAPVVLEDLVAPDLALRQRVRRDGFTGRDRRQHLLLELLGATQQHAHRAQFVADRDQRRGCAHPRHLFDDDAGGYRVTALPAVLLGDVDGGEPG